MFERIKEWVRPSRTVIGGGPVGAAAARALQHGRTGTGAIRTDTETAVDMIGSGSGLRLDLEHGKRIVRRRKKLTKSIHRAARVERAIRRYRDTGPVGTEAKSTADGTTTKPRTTVMPISMNFLWAFEVLVVVAEPMFYYLTLGRSLQENASTFERTLVAGLALLILVGGLTFARGAASATANARQRMADREGGVPGALVKAAVGVAAMACYVYAIFAVAKWRFDGEFVPGVAATTADIAKPMAVIIASTIAVDFLIRGIVMPPDYRYRLAARRVTAFHDYRRSHASAAWSLAWISLQAEVAMLLDAAELAKGSGEGLILLARDRHSGTTPIGNREPAPIADARENSFEVGAHLGFQEIPVSMRIASDALDHLAANVPPDQADGSGKEPAMIGTLRQRVGDLTHGPNWRDDDQPKALHLA